MTTDQILGAMEKAGKPIGQARLYELINKLKIKPTACRQRPQQYPASALAKIKRHYGI